MNDFEEKAFYSLLGEIYVMIELSELQKKYKDEDFYVVGFECAILSYNNDTYKISA